jgi:hypothetical protein
MLDTLVYHTLMRVAPTMKTKKPSRAELYGTKQVSEILGLHEWRVKNFSEGAAYGLPPTMRVGSGRGSRRLYGWGDIFRIAIAEHLVACGFTAEAVGWAIKEIPESVLGPYAEMLWMEKPESEGRLLAKDTPVLVLVRGAWRVRKANEMGKTVKQTLRHTESAEGLFVLNLATFCDQVFRKLYDYWSQ